MSNVCHCSVVIATCNRPGLLRKCLEALCRQSLAENLYEVIVVDDGEDPETRFQVAALRRQRNLPSMRYFSTSGRGSGPAIARNIGWKAAKGLIIAFTDDDCEPMPNWHEAGLNT